MDKKLINALGWTLENHPTRESILEEIEAAAKVPNAYWGGWGSWDATPEPAKKYYTALAKLEVWDQDFGITMSHGYHDPNDEVIAKLAKDNQEHIDKNLFPRPSPLENFLSELTRELTYPKIIGMVTPTYYPQAESIKDFLKTATLEQKEQLEEQFQKILEDQANK